MGNKMSSSEVNVNTLIETIIASKSHDTELKTAVSALKMLEEEGYFDLLPDPFTDILALIGLISTVAMFFIFSHLKFRINQLNEEVRQLKRDTKRQGTLFKTGIRDEDL